MKLSVGQRETLANEIKVARGKMEEERDQLRKIFFYSAIFGATTRTMNAAYDSHLQFIDYVLETSYLLLNQRVQAIRGGDNTVRVSNEFFQQLSNYLGELEKRIRNDKEAFDILQKISNLTFETSGNGYYLKETGVRLIQE